MGQFKMPKRIEGDRAAYCPNCRHNIDAWDKRLKRDPDAARHYRHRLSLRSARMDEVLSHGGKVVQLRRRRA